jgi:hypothetical protein
MSTKTHEYNRKTQGNDTRTLCGRPVGRIAGVSYGAKLAAHDREPTCKRCASIGPRRGRTP